MLEVLPFRGVRYSPRVRMAESICPPYDVINDKLAARLRSMAKNAIHVELPRGEGEARYGAAVSCWKRWTKSGLLASDPGAAYYVVEQKFRWGGRTHRRLGLIAAVGLRNAGPGVVRPHEKTLSKPKKDRMRLISALRVNTSPIFGLFRDGDASVRRALERTARRRPDAQGAGLDGVRIRVWRLTDPRDQSKMQKTFSHKTLLIADGHHRFEVARGFFKKVPRASSIMVYLCPEEDKGLLVLPTHRVVSPQGRVPELIERLCRFEPVSGAADAERKLARARSPYAFLVWSKERGFRLAVPRSTSGMRSGMAVEWLAKRALKGIDPHHLRYLHDSGDALAAARETGGVALLVRAPGVKEIRRAVETVGLLPQKSTYFYPKIATGLVFKTLP